MIVNDIKVRWGYDKVISLIGTGVVVDRITCEFSTNDIRIGKFGEAVCSEVDTYDRNLGRKLALTRAVASSGLSKKSRAAIWEAYRNMTKTPRW